MNQTRKVVYLWLLMLPLILGCSKDDIVPKNQMLHGGVSYELSKAAVIDYGKVDAMETYSLNLYLMSADIAIQGKNSVPDSISGKGHLMTFEMYSDKPGELAEGKYEYDRMQYRNPKTFGPAVAIFNANYQTKTGDESPIVAGTLTVSKSEQEYIIDFECMDKVGKRINGQFKGGIAYFRMH